MKGIVVFGLLALILVSVQGRPAKREHNSKLSRQEPVSVAPVVKPEVKPVVQKVAVIEPLQTGSIAPLGEIIEISTTTTTTLAPIEPQTYSTSNPLGDPKSPPPPTVVLPTVNVTGLAFPPARPPRPSSTPAPTTTKKPEEEDSSSEEEEQGPPAPGAEGGPGGPPDGPPGPPAGSGGAEEETEDNEEGGEDEPENEDDVEEEDEPKEEEQEDEEEEEEEVEDEERRRTNLQKIPEDAPVYPVGTLEDENALANSNLDAFIPGYVTPDGEVLVPIDTLEHAMPYSIIPDKRTKQGRLDIARQGLSQGESSEESLEDDQEDSGSVEDEETSSEEEEDDAVPVRINSFQILYGQQKPKKKDKDEEYQEEEPNTTEAEETDGVESVETQSPEPTDAPRPPPISDGSALLIGGAKPDTEGPPVKLSEEDLKRRPPPLAYVPATRPTNEDDEDELIRRLAFRSLFTPSVQNPYYKYYYPEPAYAYRPYENDDVSHEYYGYY